MKNDDEFPSLEELFGEGQEKVDPRRFMNDDEIEWRNVGDTKVEPKKRNEDNIKTIRGEGQGKIDPRRFIDDEEIEWRNVRDTKVEPQKRNGGNIKTVRGEDQGKIDSRRFIDDDDEVQWSKATYTKVEPQNKNEDGLKTLRNGIIALLIATAGFLAYNAGYNSDYAKHFWDDTKKTIEEKRSEEFIKDSTLNIDEVTEEYGEDR